MKTKFLVALAAVALLASCSKSSENAESEESDLLAYSPAMCRMSVSNESFSNSSSDEIAQKITRSAEIKFQTESVEQSKSYIENQVAAVSGLIDDERTNSGDTRVSCNITVRVPAEKLDTFIAAIERGAMRVESKSVSQEDVTTNYIDLSTRLENKRELEKRYKQLLTKATSMNDILSIEREMNTLRSDIESTERQLRYLDNRVTYSNVEIECYETKTVAVEGSGSLIGNALKTGLQWFAVALLGIVYLWPFLLIAACIVVPIVIKKRRKH